MPLYQHLGTDCVVLTISKRVKRGITLLKMVVIKETVLALHSGLLLNNALTFGLI